MSVAHIKGHERETLREHSQRMAEACLTDAERLKLGSCFELLCRIHDMGKAKREFEEYIEYSAAHPGDRSGRGKIDHSTAGAKYLTMTYADKNSLSHYTADILGECVCSHHSGLLDYMSPMEGQPGTFFDARVTKSEKEISYEECKTNYFNEFSQEEIDTLFLKSSEELGEFIKKITRTYVTPDTDNGAVKGDNKPFFGYHLLVKLLFGLLTDADKAAAAGFADGKGISRDSEYEKKAFEAILNALEDHISKLNVNERKGSPEIRRWRRHISDCCSDFAPRKNGTFLLAVPTGSGKTLSSLRFALRHALQNGMKRIIYVVPYLSIIENNSDTVRQLLKSYGLDENLLLEFHSNVSSEQKDKDSEYGTFGERFRYPLIFTTMVQFLDIVFSSGTQNARRFPSLCDSVVIIDEVQNLPIKCIHLFNCTLDFLTMFCNTTAVLCTATPPPLEETKRRLSYSYEHEIVPYSGEMFKAFERAEIISQVGKPYSVDGLAEFILDNMNTQNSCLTVLNTKKCAQRVYAKVKERAEGINVFCLTTNECAQHRLDIIRQVKELTEKGEKVICISTSLIEAGVDLSFTCVIRSLVGLPSICQTFGRCCRNGLERGVCYIVEMDRDAENLASLKEITDAIMRTKEVLHDYEAHPGKYDNYIISDKAVREYFDNVYANRDIQYQMDYPAGKGDTTLYNVLSADTKGRTLFEQNKHKYVPDFSMGFAYAASEFRVIDTETESLIVPYKEGRELYEALIAADEPAVIGQLLRKLQRYTVGIYPGTRKQLGNSIITKQLGNEEIMILVDTFYTEETGIVENIAEDSFTGN